MNTSKMVSVVIPIYKVERYLDKCIESVVTQTYGNLEIILVDDGSPDFSAEKCDLWSEKDRRIKVIHKENGGLSSARNAGLEIANGEYVYFLDGDDYIDKQLMETVVSYMNDGYDMVTFNYHLLFESGVIESKKGFEPREYLYNTEQETQEFFVKYLLKHKLGWAAWNRIFRKDIIDKYCIRFADNRIIFAEDLYFSLCYCAHCSKIRCLEQELYFYRQHNSSIMAQEKANINVNRMNELSKAVCSYYAEHEECSCLLSIFPVIHYLIVDNVIKRYCGMAKVGPKELRAVIIEDLEDFEFFKKQLGKLEEFQKVLEFAYSKNQIRLIKNMINFIINGEYLRYLICQQIIRVSILLERFKIVI